MADVADLTHSIAFFEDSIRKCKAILLFDSFKYSMWSKKCKSVIYQK